MTPDACSPRTSFHPTTSSSFLLLSLPLSFAASLRHHQGLSTPRRADSRFLSLRFCGREAADALRGGGQGARTVPSPSHRSRTGLVPKAERQVDHLPPRSLCKLVEPKAFVSAPRRQKVGLGGWFFFLIHWESSLCAGMRFGARIWTCTLPFRHCIVAVSLYCNIKKETAQVTSDFFFFFVCVCVLIFVGAYLDVHR